MVRTLVGWLCLMALVSPLAAEWKPVGSRLMTRWAKDVSPEKVLPEYPRPQFRRDAWQNLNGLWDYAITDRKTGAPERAPENLQPSIPEKWDGQILVPFAVESALSGVGKTVGPEQVLWYRRKFTVPETEPWKSQHIELHFGAVDWACRVFLNGKQVTWGQHTGGYDPFSMYLDMPTVDLKRDGENELVVRVSDPTDHSFQPRGKQIRKPEGIWYTSVTGIWQTVWIEPVPISPIARLKITPDVDHKSVQVEVSAGLETKEPTKANVRVEVLDGDKSVAIAEGVTKNGSVLLDLVLAEPKLWSPDSPFLYNLKVTRLDSPDVVHSYVGLRKIEQFEDENGVRRLQLNNETLFQFGPLDQGWWPDGLYTAPTDAALKFDIEMTKRLGFNMARKHVKVEPDRWYYWCDKLGLMVWQDMPSGDQYIGPNDPDSTRSVASEANYRKEWQAIINSRYNHPSIVCWVPFNEGWGQFKTNEIIDWTRELDPTRLVDGPSGWADRGEGDMHDMHMYPGPGMFPVEESRASVLGEFGGLGLPVEGHTWLDKGNWGYRSFESKAALADAYDQLIFQMPALIGQGLSAAVYTQTTDVEIEVNGLLTYDRELKFDEARMRATNLKVYGPPPTVHTLVPTSEEVPQEWLYTTEKPVDGWEAAAFDDSKWKTGPAGFGHLNPPDSHVRTDWATPDIWARRSFEIKSVDDIQNLGLRMHYDEDTEVYLNGVKIAETHGYTISYGLVPANPAAKKALKPGKNTLSIHTHQTGGGQYIDVGLVDVRFEK